MVVDAGVDVLRCCFGAWLRETSPERSARAAVASACSSGVAAAVEDSRTGCASRRSEPSLAHQSAGRLLPLQRNVRAHEQALEEAAAAAALLPSVRRGGVFGVDC